LTAIDPQKEELRLGQSSALADHFARLHEMVGIGDIGGDNSSIQPRPQLQTTGYVIETRPDIIRKNYF
jgi:hypothetical protein